ncbi:MAG: Tol-Pal system beta propeller repeat protein TolB [Candidatus Eisenbacteria bacterium]
MRRWTASLLFALCALALWGARAEAPAQDEVRIDLSTDTQKRIGLVLESLTAAGDRTAARVLSVQADPILANDLAGSGLFDVAKAWENTGSLPADAQAVVGGKLTVSGGTLVLTGEINDFPARRLIARTDYRGPVTDLRRLVHRFADEVALHLTGEAGVAQTRIAYVQKGTRSSELHVVDIDGFGPRPLTAFKSPLTSPAWTPSGQEVVFSALRGAAWNLYAVPLNGGAARQASHGGTLNIAPAVAPDGAIAYVSNKDGNSEIYVANADGGGPRRLTVNRGIDTSPAWSPTGQRIAFTSDRGGSAQVYVMDRDGGNARRLVSGFSYTDSPAWSPKGDKIAFVIRTGGGFDVYTANADGSNPRAIATGGQNENPHWSPDGRLLVFSSNRGGGRGLYISDLRGTIVRRIEVPGTVANPAWSPRPAAAR